MAASQSTTTAPGVDEIEYRDVPGFPGYMVGSDGSVWTCRGPLPGAFPARIGLTSTWKPLVPVLNRGGYAYISLRASVGARPTNRLIHHIVLEAFVGNRPKGMHGCHANGVRTDNRLANLRWDTPLGNGADKIRHGTTRGERNPRAKLSEAQVIQIRAEHAKGVSYRELARRFNLTATNVASIVKGKLWSHVPAVQEMASEVGG